MPERLQFSSEIMELLPRVRGAAARLECRWHSLWDPLELGDRIAFDRQVDGMLREAEDNRHPFARWNAAVFLVSRLHLSGDFAGAEMEAVRARGLPSPGGKDFREQVFAQQMLGLRFDQGRHDEYLDSFRTQVTGEKPVAWTVFLLLGEALNGRENDARAWLSALTAENLRNVRRDTTWFMTLTYLAELCCAVEATESALALYRNLLPFERHHALIPTAWLYRGSVARHLGGLASLLERWEEAERHLLLAIDRDRRMGAPLFVALSQYEYARLLSRRKVGPWREKADPLLDEAAATARKLGVRPLGKGRSILG
jgi:hypothetical protein